MKRKPIVLVLLAATGIFLVLYGWPRMNGLPEMQSPDISALTSVAEKMLPTLWIILISLLAAVVLAIITAAMAGYRKNKEIKRREAEKRQSNTVTTTTPTTAAPVAGTTTTTTKTTEEKTKFEWKRVGKTSWSTFALLLPICLVLVAAVLLRPDWQKDIEGWHNEPRTWATVALIAALLWMAIHNGYHRVLGWLLALGLVGLIVFLMVDTFGADTKKAWDTTWRNYAPAPASAPSVTVEINTTPGAPATPAQRTRKVIIAPPAGQWSQETFSVPRGVGFAIRASKEVRVRCKWRPEKTWIVGPTQSPDFGRDLKIVESTFEFQSTGMCQVPVTCEWEVE